MLPGGLDPGYRNALASSFEPYVLVEVLDGAGNVLPLDGPLLGDNGGLAFIGGQITATLSSRVTRQLSITFDESLYPAFTNGILAPYGNRLRVWQGVRFADSSVKRWVTFTGRIQSDVSPPDDGTLDLEVSDRANEVVEAGFFRPQNSSVGVNVFAQFQDLIKEAIPDPVFGPSDTFTQTMPQLTWESDRAAALDDIGTSIGAYWYALADGSYVLRRYPYSQPTAPVLALSDGPSGTIVATPARDRETVYNSIAVAGERTDGSAPVYGLAQDLNPSSPTYVLGKFGLRHKTVQAQTVTTSGDATSAAKDLLARSIALTETWTWACPSDPALELGDVVILSARGESGIIQVVSSFVLPLGLEGAMTVTGRARVLGLLEEL